MEKGFILLVTYWVAFAGLTGILIWGLKQITRELQRVVDPTRNRTLMAVALSEKEPDPSRRESTPGDDGSFSRIAGAIGAVSIAATFVGIGYWVLYQLFFEADLKKLSDLGTYFLAGSAMFLPYAFNRLASIFK